MTGARVVAVVATVAVLALTGTVASSDYGRAAAKEVVRDTPAEHDPQALAALHPAVRGYVDAIAARDVNALVAVFAPWAIVDDTGRRFGGRSAIRGWARDEVIGGRLTVLRTTPGPQGPTVLLHFDPAGFMAGFRARYTFDVDHDVITRVTLRYA
ncbi:nuclear transport factor 2 family protein [Streptomyces sp. NPDC102383]|uniref:nuclear transport factor 2 family protein n=1 Tax=Streptomyces sp. NPDC102383 TaxID=3366165 RepID=UPI00380C74F4